MNFEVGDWLLSPEDEIIELLELDLENGVHNKIKKNGSASLAFNGYLKQCRKWEPKNGEWVIPDTGINEDMFVVMKYNGVSLIPSRCRPFLGELPYES